MHSPRSSQLYTASHSYADLSAQRPERIHSAGDVIARYGWGQTRGHQYLKDRSLVPAPVMTHPNRWRLDQFITWEEKRMAFTEAALEDLVARKREEVTVTAPRPMRRRRSA